MMPAVISAFTKCKVIDLIIREKHCLAILVYSLKKMKIKQFPSQDCEGDATRWKIIISQSHLGEMSVYDLIYLLQRCGSAFWIFIFILLSYLDPRWGYAFWIFAGLCLFGMLVFLLFATTQVQANLSIIVVMFTQDYICLVIFTSNKIWWYWQEQPFNSNDYTGSKALEAAKLESNFSEKQEVDQTKEPWSLILHLSIQ